MTLSLKLRCLSPLILCICIPRMEKCTTLCGIVCQWFSLGTLVSSANKTDCHDITEILLKVTLNTIKPTKPTNLLYVYNYSIEIWSVTHQSKVLLFSFLHHLYTVSFDHGYVPLVVSTSRSFRHSRLITGFATEVT